MRAVIFANGILERPRLAAGLLQPDDFIIAADGGLHHIQKLELVPDLLVGDLDSVGAEDAAWLKERRVEVQQYPVDKDFTDLELAIQAALRRGARKILIVAALGGRLDQALANIALLSLTELKGVDIALDDGVTEVCRIESRLEISGRPGDLVSLLPLGGPAAGVVTHDLKYPLRAETLTPGQTRGISNVMQGENAAVELAGGNLLCVHIRQILEQE